jgi:hypothetical protein
MYVKPARGYKMNMSGVDQFCSRGGYGMREGELSRAFDVFLTAAAELMSMGYRIDTTIGSFAPKLALRREITDAADVKNSDADHGVGSSDHFFRYPLFRYNLAAVLDVDALGGLARQAAAIEVV